MINTVVIDCSALIRALTDHSPAGFAVRERLRDLDTLAAPGLLDYDIMSALFGMTKSEKLTDKEAVKAVADYQALAIVRHETLVLWQRVRALHHNISAYEHAVPSPRRDPRRPAHHERRTDPAQRRGQVRHRGVRLTSIEGTSKRQS